MSSGLARIVNRRPLWELSFGKKRAALRPLGLLPRMGHSVPSSVQMTAACSLLHEEAEWCPSGVSTGADTVQHFCWWCWWWDRVLPHQGRWRHQALWCSQCTGGKGSIPEGPGQAGEVGPCKPRKFNKAQWQVLHLGWGNPRHTYKLGREGIESSPADKHFGVMVDEQLNMSWQHELTAQKTEEILSCIQRNVGNRAREGIPPLYSALVRPHLECSIQHWCAHHKKDMELLEQVERRSRSW